MLNTSMLEIRSFSLCQLRLFWYWKASSSIYLSEKVYFSISSVIFLHTFLWPYMTFGLI